MAVNDLVLEYLGSHDIEIVGFADLSPLPPLEREHFPYGISFGIPYSREGLIENIKGRPRRNYDEYLSYNQRMADVGIGLAQELADLGYKAAAKPQHSITYDSDLRSVLPYKTVARLAGLGWIGKCALMVSEKYGSAFRLSMVLTTAPLICDEPIETSLCESDCTICRDVCPGSAPSGRLWELGKDRSEFFEAALCREAALRRARALMGIEHSVCALCMANCPFTKRALGY